MCSRLFGTQNIQILGLQKKPLHALLVTIDVVGLHLNIPHCDGADAGREYLAQRPVCAPATEDLPKLIHLVHDINCFTFKGKHYRQTLGTAMGTHVSPSFDNLFMAVLEKKILATAPESQTPEFFKRFIDDLLLVRLHGEESLLHFFDNANRAHPAHPFNLQWYTEDLFITTRQRLHWKWWPVSSDLCTKPTDSHQYLLPSNNHPPGVHEHLRPLWIGPTDLPNVFVRWSALNSVGGSEGTPLGEGL